MAIGEMIHSTQTKSPSSPTRMSIDVSSRRSLEVGSRKSVEVSPPSGFSMKLSSDISCVMAARCAEPDVLLSGGSGAAEDFSESLRPADKTMWRFGGQ